MVKGISASAPPKQRLDLLAQNAEFQFHLEEDEIPLTGWHPRLRG
jgi:hypothetical protein